MRAIEITEDWPFSSYPNGTQERHWKKGDTDTVPNDHAKLLVETKGFARYVDDPAIESAAPAKPTPVLKKDQTP